MKTEQRTGFRLTWKWVIGILVAGSIAIYYLARFFSGHVPISTLSVEKLPEHSGNPKEVCDGPILLPLTVDAPDWRFPAYSPDGHYYADVIDISYRDAIELRLYVAETDNLLGIYSYKTLYVYCWSNDSSGIYVRDWDPGVEGILWPFLNRPGHIGILKKVLVQR